MRVQLPQILVSLVMMAPPLAVLCASDVPVVADNFHRYTGYDPDLPEHTIKAEDFSAPSGFARPQTWWHWIGGDVSRDGIEADLREMADKGYGGVRIFHVAGKNKGGLKFDSPEWFDTFRFAVEKARDHGLDLGIHACDGWSEAGGPWITPELSMKELTFCAMRVTGNGSEQRVALPELDRKCGFVRDVAVLAWPAKRPAELAMHRAASAQVVPATPETRMSGAMSDLFDGKLGRSVTFAHDNSRRDQVCGVLLEFEEPLEIAGVCADVLWNYEPPRNVCLEASIDGTCFERVCELSFYGERPVTFAPRRAKYWRFVRYQSSDPSERVRRGVEKEHELALTELELLAPGEHSRVFSPIDNMRAKAGLIAVVGPVEPTRVEAPEDILLRRDEIRDLTDHCEAGVLRWNAPAGEWVVMRVGYTSTGRMNHPASPEGTGLEVDKFDPAAIEFFFRAYPDRMVEAAGALAGSAFCIIATDSWEARHQNWTERMPEYFRAENGYDVVPWLPVLAGECIDSMEESECFLRDLRRTYAALLARNYYGKLGELVRARGVRYETEPVVDMCFRNPMTVFREADIPMDEIWQDPREPGVVVGVREPTKPEVSSAAHFYGKQFVTCESLTSRKGNWAESPWTLNGSVDTILFGGFNTLVFHTFTHQPDERAPGWQMDPWGIALNRKVPWWSFARPWFDEIARKQYMLQQGKAASRVLILYADDVPAEVPETLLAEIDEADLIDGDGVRRFLRVDNGRLVSPGRIAYEVMIVAPGCALQLETLERLRELLSAGARICAPARPVSPPSLRGGLVARERWQALVGELFGDGRKQVRHQGAGTLYVGYTPDEALRACGVRKEFLCKLNGDPASDIGWVHREHVDGTEWFWVVNRVADGARAGVMSFAVTGKGVSLWHPGTGAIEPAPILSETDGYTQVPLRLEAMEGVFVVFQGAAAKRAVVRAEWTGAGGEPAPRDMTVALGDDGAPRLRMLNDVVCAEFCRAGSLRIERADGSRATLAATDVPAARYLEGPFLVTFDPKWGGPAEPQAFDALTSWTRSDTPGVRHYSGIGTYTKSFEMTSAEVASEVRVALEIGAVAEVAEVTLNGQRVGVLWRPPYRIDVTRFLRVGANELRVAVANTWVNRCLYDATLPEPERLTWANTMSVHYPDPRTIRATDYFPWKSGPLPSGLIGEMKLVFSRLVRAE